MANFFDNKLEPYEKNKIVVNDLVTTENYRRHHELIKNILLDSLTSQAFNELSMRLIGTLYVFSEDELKELLNKR